jgi:hypothetical protein
MSPMIIKSPNPNVRRFMPGNRNFGRTIPEDMMHHASGDIMHPGHFGRPEHSGIA